MKGRPGRAVIVTLGPWHERPWWWNQLAPAMAARLEYERIALDGKSHHQLGLGDIPRLVARLGCLIRRVTREDLGYIVTFESDLTCYLIGLLQWLPGFRTPRHVIVQFISREADGSVKSRLKDIFQRVCLRTVHRVVCSSRREAQYYERRFGWPPGKCVYVALQSDERYLDHPGSAPTEAIVAAGRSYRDYATLAEAVRGTGVRTIIVCGRKGPGIRDVPKEVEVVAEIPLAALSDLLASARAVVLPLLESRISTGQSVLLQAMGLGRPVIATRTAGTEDYVENGYDGLLVPPGDAIALREAILRLMASPVLAEEMGRRSRHRISAAHLPRHYADGVARAIGCG